MKTKSTDSSDEPKLKKPIGTSSKTLDTVVIPGMSPRSPQPSDSCDSTPRIRFWQGLYWPLRRTAIVVGSILLLSLIGSSLFNLVKDTIYKLTYKSTPASPAQEQPKIKPSNPFTQITASNSTNNNCTDLPIRMAKAKITGSQVDKIFYQKHRKNSLSKTDADRELRQEWCAISNKLIDKKQTE
ncbi:MAG: hypothetical protein LH474_13225 [Chamaesiphon sp.]|nr:hypothetical protein [Chamaesiphon sp.]